MSLPGPDKNAALWLSPRAIIRITLVLCFLTCRFFWCSSHVKYSHDVFVHVYLCNHVSDCSKSVWLTMLILVICISCQKCLHNSGLLLGVHD